MDYIYIIIAVIGGAIAGYFFRRLFARKQISAMEMKVQEMLAETTTKQKEMLLEAKEQAVKVRADVDAENRGRRIELLRLEKKISQKEENLDRKMEGMERRDNSMRQKESEIDSIRNEVDSLRKQQQEKLEKIANMTNDQAKALLLEMVEVETRDDVSRRIHDTEARLKLEADHKAREIVVLAAHRMAADIVSESTVSSVPLPSDEMKGRLIGREGRNIRALEAATGVDLIIDDTPEVVTISSFDPVRRETARLALEKLIVDGRIHPGRIEEVVNKARLEVEANIFAEGEKAAYEIGIGGLNPELIKILGRLKYRFSYGQNVLAHSIEVAHLSGMIAAELGADVNISKAAGLLHDIGKAVDHEVEGTHAAIGADIAKRYGRSTQVVRAIGDHHNDEGSIELYGLIVSTADAISSARPGARRESLEFYLKRLETLENVANSFAGVEKSFAIQAGREVRIIVKPNEVDDLGALRLARDIVKKIEESMEYPGQIKVTIIRETRAVDYAK
ncbi:MAG: ribonuclease Y [Chloroflexi bacterium]|nr:ribonuclease Y [Chloroflexota bacterium]